MTSADPSPSDAVPRWSRVWSMVTVEPVVFCYMFGVFLQYTAFLSLTYDKSCLMLYNSTFCAAMDNRTFQREHKAEQDSIQTENSYWLIVTNVTMTVPAILSVFFLMGPWGDKVDRKLPVLFPCAGSFLYSLSNLVNARYLSWPILALIPGLAINGLAGGYGTMLMAGYSYITHISGENNRMVRVGIVGSTIYMAATISVFISGLLVQTLGHVLFFGIVSCFMGAGFLYGVFLLPSVVPEEKDETRGESWCDRFVMGTIRETWSFVTRRRDSTQKLLLTLEILILNIVHMCTTGESNIIFLYLKRAPRSFSRAEYGYFRGAENFTRSLALITLLPLLRQRFSFRHSTIVIIGLVCKTGTLLVLGFADSLVVVFLAAIPALLQGFPAAGLRASMAGRVDLHEHGRLFGVVAATQSCVTLATTFIFNGWYPSTLNYFDGTCFLFAAGMCVLATGIAFFVHTHSKNEQPEIESQKTEKDGHPENHLTDVPLEKQAALTIDMGAKLADNLIEQERGKLEDDHLHSQQYTVEVNPGKDSSTERTDNAITYTERL